MAFVSSSTVSVAEAAAAAVLQDLKLMRNCYDQVVAALGTIKARIQALTDDELAEFANAIGSVHYVNLNTQIPSQLGDLEILLRDTIDIISNADKTSFSFPDYSGFTPSTQDDIDDVLATQGRQLVLTGGVYSVDPYP